MAKRYENFGDPRLPPGKFVHESDYDALLAAAEKVTCMTCEGTGIHRGWPGRNFPCPDCSDLRLLMEKGK